VDRLENVRSKEPQEAAMAEPNSSGSSGLLYLGSPAKTLFVGTGRGFFFF
jgi:hypothetical protein